MIDNLVIIGLLNKSFSNDNFSIYYNGHFDDVFTEKIISIAEYDIEKKSKRKLSFLIAESFQNIVRHGDDNFKTGSGSLFGLRGDDDYIHIFSSNKVDVSAKTILESKLAKINSLDKDELKSYYMEVLSVGEISEKGGAGLGLIDMAKKSDRPLQIDFRANKNNSYQFSLQIDLPLNKDVAYDEVLEIDENIALHKIIRNNKILFFYKGEFSDELLGSMLSILKENVSIQGSIGFSIFNAAVELMQNISRHGAKDSNEKINGVFSLQEFDDCYYLSTGNSIDASMDALVSNIETINECTKEELDNLYRSSLKKSIENENNSAGVGLIDIRRTTLNKIDINTNREDNYMMLGIKISKK